MSNIFPVGEQNFLLLIVKIFFIIISVIYAIFAFMVVRQVSLMNKSFTASLHGFFTFLAWVHFIVALLAIFLAVTVL